MYGPGGRRFGLLGICTVRSAPVPGQRQVDDARVGVGLVGLGHRRDEGGGGDIAGHSDLHILPVAHLAGSRVMAGRGPLNRYGGL